jgi:hypothetical protein
MADNAMWLREAGWGIMCHYLAGLPGSGDDAREITAQEWNAQVDAFRLEEFIDQIASTRARYLLFTVGQNSGHYCAPNETYDELTGIEPSNCSRRDLIADIADALAPHDVRLMVYTTGGAPDASSAADALGWVNNHQQPGHRLADFQRNWNRILTEWSERWAHRVSGWWVDGCYFAETMYEFDDEPNWDSLRRALKAGNDDAIVAFNPGVEVPVITQGPEDYTAGEIAGALPVGGWRDGEFRTIPSKVGDAQYHVLTFLGQMWRRGTPRFPDDLAVGYTKFVTAHDGAITWDVPIEPSGLIPQAFVEQLQAIGEASEGPGNPR